MLKTSGGFFVWKCDCKKLQMAKQVVISTIAVIFGTPKTTSFKILKRFMAIILMKYCLFKGFVSLFSFFVVDGDQKAFHKTGDSLAMCNVNTAA